MRNQWTQTRIDYHPCTTNEPTTQVCQSPGHDITHNSFLLEQFLISITKFNLEKLESSGARISLLIDGFIMPWTNLNPEEPGQTL